MLRRTLLTQHPSSELVGRLIKMIEEVDDLALVSIRPHALADHWGVWCRSVLELFLLATRAGLLEFRWELLCPLCRGDQQSAGTLSGIQAQVHCDSCNIDFTVNFDQSVELTFHPNPAVRPITSREFCIGGPPRLRLISQSSSCSSLDPGGPCGLCWNPGVTGCVLSRCEEVSSFPGHRRGGAGDYVSLQPARAGPGMSCSCARCLISNSRNSTDEQQLFILERMAWNDQAATAAEVTGMQMFRDLFSSEALRPGEQISVGYVTVLFTDLLGSTRLYREIGDAPAFGCVMDHFEILRNAISAQDGAVVKTIGDSVMAIFRRPAAGLKAMTQWLKKRWPGRCLPAPDPCY